jgi:nucleoside-diphosphate-sugar epimerase
MRLLENKRVLVTGGSRGIGAGLVRTLLQEGAETAFFFRRSAEAADTLCQEMADRYPDQRCLAIQCDVADTHGMQEAVKNVTLELGAIDVLVNNAGLSRDAAFARMTREQWDEVIDTNLGSMYNVTQPLTLQFVKQRSGSIINITSAAGVYGSSGQANYAASKAGVVGLPRPFEGGGGIWRARQRGCARFHRDADDCAMQESRLNYAKSRNSCRRLGTLMTWRTWCVFWHPTRPCTSRDRSFRSTAG